MNKLIEIVQEINNEMYENNPALVEQYGIALSYLTDGNVELVSFMDIIIFNSDDQEIDEVTDDYRVPSVDYFKHKIRDVLYEIKKGLTQ